MTDTHAKTLPPSVKNRALTAIAQLTAWNDAVIQARAMEALTGQPGRFEYDLIDGTTSLPLLRNRDMALVTLGKLEARALAQGLALQDLYAAVGQPRPDLVPEGPRVHDWRKGQR